MTCDFARYRRELAKIPHLSPSHVEQMAYALRDVLSQREAQVSGRAEARRAEAVIERGTRSALRAAALSGFQ